MTTATPSVTRRSIASVNPYNDEVLAEFPAMTDEEAGRAVAAAHQAFQEWRSLAPAERAAVVGRAASLMRERQEELARTVTLEMGKLIGESRGEADLSADILSYYAEHGPAFLADRPLPVEEGNAVVANRPLGALLGIMPWNYPLYQVARFAAPNLVAEQHDPAQAREQLPAVGARVGAAVPRRRPRRPGSTSTCSCRRREWAL